MVERLGSETIVNATLSQGAPLLAVLDGDRPMNIGETAHFGFDPAKVVLFDSGGKSLFLE
ncbi:hypothetical protein D9M68_996890 [compost metagenome]